MHMNNVWWPVKFLYGLHDTFGKENGTLIIIREQVSFFIGKRSFSFEIFFIVTEIKD